MSSPDTPKSSTKDDKEHEELDREESNESGKQQESEATTASETTTPKPTIGVEDEEKDEKTEVDQETAADAASAPQHDWQAIYSPPHNAYYFYNAKTQETTWENPLVPDASASTPTVAPADDSQISSVASTTAVNPMLDGIDPELAYLDPNLAGGASGAVGAYAARFNARTGRFTAMDGRDPTHLSEYERMKRMSNVFFDMGAWEQDVAARKEQEAADEAEGRRRKKKPSKADLERFKAQKEARKKTKYAWLRE